MKEQVKTVGVALAGLLALFGLIFVISTSAVPTMAQELCSDPDGCDEYPTYLFEGYDTITGEYICGGVCLEDLCCP